MRSSKSILAGVAAGALAVGFLSVAGATSAGAAGQKSPKAAASTVTAVRAGAVGQIPTAKLSLPAAMARPTTLQVAGAPSNTATVYLETSGGEYPATLDDSATLLRNGTVGSLADDSVVGIAVDTAGTYTVRLGNGSDTTSATFTTTGNPASISWSPASQTVLVGSPATMALSLKDSAGNLTQAALGDTIAVAASADDTPSPSSVTAAAIYTGSATVTVPVVQAGTQTITATPLGTLPPAVVAATTSLTGSGSVSALAVTNVLVTSPTAANSNPVASSVSPTRAVQVPAGSASIGIQVDDTTANAAGTQLRLGFTLNSAAVSAGASINGTTVTATDDTVYVNVTTNASKIATTTVTLGGAALNTGAVLTMGQYTVTNTVVAGVGLQVSELSPAVYGSGVTFSPAGPLVGTLGTAVPVTVSVDDSFGRPQSGWTVQAWRDVATDVLLSTGTTNASGDAAVTVVNASGLTSGSNEQYYFTAIPPVGSSVNSANNLTVAWTTSGGITSLSVGLSVGSSPIADPVGTAPTTGPLLTAPFDGVANTGSSATYNLTTGAAGGTANGGETATLTPTATPANAVLVTVPVGSTGIFVSATNTTAWNAGQTAVTVASGAPVYVFGTKVGEHTITLTSGGKSVNVKVKVQTSANAAYNINVTPTEQTIAKGGFGSATVTLTDVFGNAVPGADDTNAVTVTASGEVRLGGLNVTQNLTVGADGTGTISLVAGTDGTGAISVTPKVGAAAPAWQTPYTPPAGAPAPKTSDAAVVKVGAVPSDKSITITGSRTTVSGKPGIKIDGVVSGIEDGKTVIPYFRFPGETTFTQGSARPEITDGSFVWQRKTGKKFYAYVTNDDGSTTSNRVIIPAN
jgi:hypothetical protein